MKLYGCLLTLLSLVACVSPTTHYPDLNPQEVGDEARTQQQLVKAGSKPVTREFDEAMRNAQFERLKQVGGRVARSAQSLCQHTLFADKPCRFDFVLIQNEGVNAFADGEKIYVSLDMLAFADKDEELALVLGHEYAHNIMGHVGSKKANTMVGTLFGAALDITAGSLMGGTTGSLFRNLGTQAGQLAYSKAFEKEADYVGIYIAALADYPIHTAPGFWRKMSLNHPKAIYVATTHPTNPERYLGLRKTVTEIQEKQAAGVALVPNMRLDER